MPPTPLGSKVLNSTIQVCHTLQLTVPCDAVGPATHGSRHADDASRAP